MTKLKPCRWCGIIPELHEWPDTWWSIFCFMCSIEIGDFKTKRAAVAAWNRRAKEKP